MIIKITRAFLLLFLLTACASLMNSSKYETVYSTTINSQAFKPIYQILKDNLPDFPQINNGKINYKKQNNRFFLKIHLSQIYFKLQYNSPVGHDDKIEKIKSKIEAITSDKQK